MDLGSVMSLILKEDVKRSRNIGSPVATPLCLSVEQQKWICAGYNKGSTLGLDTLLKEDRAEVIWTHLLKLHIMPFGSSRFSEHSCVASRRSHWVALFLS